MADATALRVLHLVCGPHERGGMQKHVLDLTAAQRAMGDVPGLIAHPTYAGLVAEGVEHLPLDTTRSRRDASFRADIAVLLGRWRPDVVHAHAGKASAIIASLFPLRCAAVATVHGLKRDLRAPARFDRVIAVSEFAGRRLPAHKRAVVYNGIDSMPPARGSLSEFFGGRDDEPIAVAVGRLAPVKGFATAVRAWPLVSRGRLLIVGDGPERSRLERLIARLALGDRVALAGSRPDGSALIARSALLVAPSQREGFPYVVAEALHARVPIVTTTTSGASPLMPAEYLVAPGRARRLASVIERALSDPDGARAAFGPVFERARVELTLAGMAKGTREVYIAALGVARARSR